jgi:hypothetical protein
MHASNVLRGSSIGVHPLPIHLHHIKSKFFLNCNKQDKDEEG